MNPLDLLRQLDEEQQESLSPEGFEAVPPRTREGMASAGRVYSPATGDNSAGQVIERPPQNRGTAADQLFSERPNVGDGGLPAGGLSDQRGTQAPRGGLSDNPEFLQRVMDNALGIIDNIIPGRPVSMVEQIGAEDNGTGPLPDADTRRAFVTSTLNEFAGALPEMAHITAAEMSAAPSMVATGLGKMLQDAVPGRDDGILERIGSNLGNNEVKGQMAARRELGLPVGSTWSTLRNQRGDEAREYWRNLRRERLGLGGTIASAIIGNLHPRSLLNTASQAVSSQIRQSARGVPGAITRAGTQAGLAAAATGARELATGEHQDAADAVSTAGVSALLAGALGGAGQAVGDLAVNVGRYAGSSPGIKRMMDKLWDTGDDVSPLAPDNFAETAAAMPPGSTLLEMPSSNKSGPSVTQRAIGLALDMEFPTSRSDMKNAANPGDFARIREAIAQATDHMDTLNQRFTASTNAIIGLPASPTARARQLALETGPYRDFYRSLDSAEPGAIGATPVDVDSFLADLGKEYGRRVRRPKGPEQMSGYRLEVWNRIVQIMREKGSASQNFNPNNPLPPGTGSAVIKSLPYNAFTNPTHGQALLANVFDARRTIADMLLPGAMREGTSLAGQQRNALKELLAALDEQIYQRAGQNIKLGKSATGTDYQQARRGFAEAMAAKDRFEFGKNFYRDMFAVEDFSGKSGMEYFNSLTPKQKEQVREGFRSAMAENFAERGAYQEMFNVFGDLSRLRYDQMSALRAGRADLVDQMLGAGTTRKMLDNLFDNHKQLQDTNDWINALVEKRRNPAATRDSLRDGDELILTDAFRPGQQSMLSNASLGGVGRYAMRGTSDDAMRLIDLMTTPNPAQKLDYYKQVVESRPVSYERSGAMSQGIVSSGTTEGDFLFGPGVSVADREREVEERVDSLPDWMRALDY